MLAHVLLSRWLFKVFETTFNNLSKRTFLAAFLLMPLWSFSALANVAPVITSTPTLVVDEGSPYSYLVTTQDGDGDPVTVSVPTLPNWLSFNSSNNTLSGTPSNTDVGPARVVVRATDGQISVEQTYTLTVANVNDNPVVVANIQSVTTNEDEPFTLNVAGNFADNDPGDQLTFSAVNLPGGLSITQGGVIQGSPTNDDALIGTFNVTVTATDLAKTSASTLFQMIIININDAPAPVNDIAVLSEDSNIIIEVLKNDIDVDDPLLPSTVSIITQPLHGSASVNTQNGLITYIPTANYAGSDTIEYRITDPLGLPGSAKILITVLPINDPPVAQNDVVFTSEDTTVAIDVLANDSDPDQGDAPQGSQIVIESPPANGAVTITNGKINYTPNSNFNGSDSLQYKAADINGVFSNTATVTITIGEINDIPTAGDDIGSTFEDTPVQIVVLNNDSDTEDGSIDPATMSILNQPSNGTASITSTGLILYTPKKDFNGSDSLQYTVKDSKGNFSNAATVSINVTPVNDTPIANNDLVSLLEDTSIEINVLGNDTDVDGVATINTGSVTIVSPTIHGGLFVDSITGIVRYSPDADYFGSDSFTYNITDDGALTSTNATVLLTIASVNDAPRLANDSATTNEDTTVTIDIITNDIDVDGTFDLTTLAFSQSPAHGTATFNADGQIVYKPDLNYHGNDLLAYTIKDNDGLISTIAASVLLTINSVNDAPVGNQQSVSTLEDKPLLITLTGSDVDADPLSYVITRTPLHGTISGSSPTFTYTPNKDYNGPDSLNFQATDGLLNSPTVFVAITVVSVNDRPVATARTVTVNEDQPIDITLTGTDIDGDSLTFGLAGGNLGGTITGVIPNITYTPAANFNGEESLLFFANDSKLDSGVEAITIRVLAVNDIPTVKSQSLFLTEDTSVNITLIAEDIDGDSLTFIIETQPSHGVLSGTAPNLIYKPNQDYFGTDEFSYKVSDGNVSSSSAQIKLTIAPNGDVPVASAQTVIGNEDQALQITLTGFDPDGNELIYQVINSPTRGSLAGTPPLLTYTPSSNFNGQDQFEFKVSDGGFESDKALVTITIVPVNDPPVAIDDVFSLSMAGKQWLTLDVLANDEDIDGDALTLISVQSDFGQVVINNNQLRFVPEDGFVGDVLIHYLMQDTSGETAAAQAQLSVLDNNGVNDPQITVPANINTVATGRITKVNLGSATAIDAQGNTIPVSLLDNRENFPPGAHTVFWQAVDSAGNRSVASQKVNIFPLVSVTANQTVTEGHEVTVVAKLNGPAPVYPIVIPYTVEGSASAGLDYELAAGEFRFNQGTEAELHFMVFADQLVEENESVIIKLADSPYRSQQATHQVNIIADNGRPALQLISLQNNQPRFLIAQDDGLVTVVAHVKDANSDDSHELQWLPQDGIIRTDISTERTFVFDPQTLEPGIYYLGASVVDNAEEAKTSQTKIFFEVVASLPELGTEDTDGDLINDNIEGFADRDLDHIADWLDPISDCTVVPESALQVRLFLVEGEQGGCLRRGSATTMGQSGGLLLDELALASLVDDPDANNIGGVFDFEVHGLDESMPVYHLVIPQRTPIPLDAVYRKLNSQGQWHSFVQNEHNQLFSTPGSQGICPPPKATSWQPGLGVGHWCVQLMIEDGGPNDADGSQNGSIHDPGGLAVFNSSNSFPIATADLVEVLWNTTSEIDVLANDSDADQDILVIISAQAQLGDVQINNGLTLSYTTLANFIGEDTVSYSISDGHGGIASSTLKVTIKGNSAPVAKDDTATTSYDKPVTVNVLANDSDADGDALTLTNATVNIGTITLTQDNRLTYTPQINFVGTATANYRIQDATGAVAQAQLFIGVSAPIVQPPPPPPPTDGGNSGDSGGSLPYGYLLLLLSVAMMRRYHVQEQKQP